jgi:hypothetical protein
VAACTGQCKGFAKLMGAVLAVSSGLRDGRMRKASRFWNTFTITLDVRSSRVGSVGSQALVCVVCVVLVLTPSMMACVIVVVCSCNVG